MIHIPNLGLLFCIALAVVILSSWLMGRQGKLFFTKDPLRRKFSILEMEFPAKSYDLEYLIKGIYLLPEAQTTVKAVKRQLLLDYLLFIPAAYGGIFLLSMHVATSIPFHIGQYLFAGLAWAQIIPFVLDYIENTYFWILVGKRDIYIPPPVITKEEPQTATFKLMQWLERFKWGIPLITFVSCLSVMAYSWLSGGF